MKRAWIIVFILCVFVTHYYLNMWMKSPWLHGGLGYPGTPIWLDADDLSPIRLILDVFIAACLFSAVGEFIKNMSE